MFSNQTPKTVRFAGTWLLISAAVNGWIAYQMWGERGERNRVCWGGRALHGVEAVGFASSPSPHRISQAWIAKNLMRKGAEAGETEANPTTA
jgi:hypothetical protein